MEDTKRAEIKSLMLAKWDEIGAEKMAEKIEHYHIFGNWRGDYVQDEGAPRSEHYTRSELQAIVDEIIAEKTQ